jgi:hypothetical protein
VGSGRTGSGWESVVNLRDVSLVCLLVRLFVFEYRMGWGLFVCSFVRSFVRLIGCLLSF